MPTYLQIWRRETDHPYGHPQCHVAIRHTSRSRRLDCYFADQRVSPDVNSGIPTVKINFEMELRRFIRTMQTLSSFKNLLDLESRTILKSPAVLPDLPCITSKRVHLYDCNVRFQWTRSKAVDRLD